MNNEKHKAVMNLINGSKERTIAFNFIGPPGCGKTWNALRVNKDLKCEVFKIDGSPNLCKEDMEGNFITKGTEVVFNYGIIPQAIISANKNGFAVIIVNEFNNLLPNVQASFNALLDFQGELNLGINGGERLVVEEGKKLIFISTMNEDLAGLNPLQEAMKTRFEYFIEFDYPTFKEELNMYKSSFENERSAELYTEFIREIRSMYISDNKLESAITIREGLAFLTAKNIIDPKIALEYCITRKVTNDKIESSSIMSLAQGKNLFASEKKLIKIAKSISVEISDTDIPKILKDKVEAIFSDELETVFRLKTKYISNKNKSSITLTTGKTITTGDEIDGFICRRRNKKLYMNSVDFDTGISTKIILHEE